METKKLIAVIMIVVIVLAGVNLLLDLGIGFSDMTPAGVGGDDSGGSGRIGLEILSSEGNEG